MNRPKGYSWTAIVLHWVMGVMMIVTFLLGESLGQDSYTVEGMVRARAHESLGLMIGLLVWIRLLVNAYRRPAPLPTHKRWERWLSRVIVVVFYVLMIGLPLSGIAQLAAGRETLDLWIVGSIPLPEMAIDEEIFEEAHEIMGKVLVLALVLHVAGALKHLLIDRDSTLRRMLWPIR